MHRTITNASKRGTVRHTRDDGTWEDSAVVKTYKQHQDAWLVAQQRYAGMRASAEASTDATERERWRTMDEPREQAELDAIEQAWTIDGHKNEVESAQARLANLGSRSPIQAWADWNARFNDDIDALHGSMFQGEAFPSPFAPTNALDEGAWLPFTLNDTEIARLTAEAPADLRAKLDTDGPSALTSLSFEFSSATILRPWFSQDVFKARFWRLAGGAPAICDGATPPSGVCPACVTAVVFARHIREEHRSGGTTTGTRFDGFRFVTGRAGAFGRLPPAAVVRDHRVPPTGARVLRTAAVVAQPAAVVAPAAAPVHAVAVPPASAAKLRALRDMGFMRLAVPATPAPPSTPAAPQSDETYLLAFICKRVGKCPDPDPGLTW